MDSVLDLTYKVVEYMEEARKNNYTKMTIDRDIYRMLNKFYEDLTDYVEKNIREEYEEKNPYGIY